MKHSRTKTEQLKQKMRDSMQDEELNEPIERIAQRWNIPALIAIAVSLVAFLAIWIIVAIEYCAVQLEPNANLEQCGQVSSDSYEALCEQQKAEESKAQDVRQKEQVQKNDDAIPNPAPTTSAQYSIKSFRSMGVINWSNFRWTWYASSAVYDKDCVLGSDGVWRYQGMIVLASSQFAKGTVVDTPFGEKGIVLDCGCDFYTFDVHTAWK